MACARSASSAEVCCVRAMICCSAWLKTPAMSPCGQRSSARLASNTPAIVASMRGATSASALRPSSTVRDLRRPSRRRAQLGGAPAIALTVVDAAGHRLALPRHVWRSGDRPRRTRWRGRSRARRWLGGVVDAGHQRGRPARSCGRSRWRARRAWRRSPRCGSRGVRRRRRRCAKVRPRARPALPPTSPMRALSRWSASSKLRRMSPARAASTDAVSTARATRRWSASSNVPAISRARVARTGRGARRRDPLSAVETPRSRARATARGFVGAGDERPRIGVGAARQFAIGLVEGVGDFSARASRALDVFSARSAILRSASLKALPASWFSADGDFEHLVAQRAGDDHGALFEHLADVVDAGRQRALHGAGALLDDAGLAAERSSIFSTSAASSVGDSRCGGRRSVLAWHLHDVVEAAARVSASLRRSSSSARASMLRPSASLATWPATISSIARGFGKLLEVGFERAGQDVAALGQFLDLAGDQSVDACTAFGELLQVGFQRAGEDVAASASFSTWPATSPSMLDRVSASLSRSASSARSEDIAAFGELLDLTGDKAVDAGAAFGQLAEVGLQRARQDAAALGTACRRDRRPFRR